MTAVAERLEVTEPGVYDLPDEVYHADPVPGGSLSSSGAKLLLPPNVPALYRWRLDHPAPPKREYDLGHAAHKLVLGTGPTLAVVDADSWRTKAAKQEAAEARAAGEVPLLAHEHAEIKAMAEALARHPLAVRLFDPAHGRAEQSLFWQDDEFGVWRRARLDWLPDGISSAGRLIIPDYKTCDRADAESIRKAVARYGYHQQRAWYDDAARAVLGYEQVAFLFVFQERTAPYLVHVVELDVEAVREGRHLNRQALGIYAECTATGTWPGYSDHEPNLVDLPRWAITERKTW
ncbi:PD-(D/E)XK nuclease-like domain-containing protein [Saccharothrix sp. HUAS TT1]|uniref:PD-(D/E)XK nuclease-like domain-containing protein n=1 Tax=unclassified Saccharothrix TaxID=2593673 RepID=UPI00345B79AA